MRGQEEDKRRILAYTGARGRLTKISTSWNQEKELSFDQNPRVYHFDRNCQEFTIPKKGLSLNQSKGIY